MQQVKPAQVRRYLKQLKQRQEQYLYYLGQLAYQAGEQGRLEEGPLLDAYRTLKNIQEQITRWEAYLESLRATKEAARQPRCPRCGNPVVTGSVSCLYCGQLLAPSPGVGAPAAPQSVGASQVSPTSSPMAAQPQGLQVTPQGTFPSPGTTFTTPDGTPYPGTIANSGTSPMAGGLLEPGKSAGIFGERTCPTCGAVVDPEAVFCGNCGMRVRSSAESTTGPPSVARGAPPEAIIATEECKYGEAVQAAAPENVGPEMPMAVSAESSSGEEPPGASGGLGTEALRCPGCGWLVNDPEARFCPDCGTRLRE